jgi:hypothetical protein
MVSIDKPSTDPFLHIRVFERHSEIMISLNIHSLSLIILERWCGRISTVTIVQRYHFSGKMDTVKPIDNTVILIELLLFIAPIFWFYYN